MRLAHAVEGAGEAAASAVGVLGRRDALEAAARKRHNFSEHLGLVDFSGRLRLKDGCRGGAIGDRRGGAVGDRRGGAVGDGSRDMRGGVSGVRSRDGSNGDRRGGVGGVRSRGGANGDRRGGAI